jgi:hypothetical protein
VLWKLRKKKKKKKKKKWGLQVKILI